jgi:hypothetical protein
MSDHISPLELAGEDVEMDDNDLTMHVSPPEGDPAQLAKDLDMARDELEKSGEFGRHKIRKIMASLEEAPSPNDPLFQPTWTASLEVDVAFNELYPRAMYTFASTPPPPLPAELPPTTRALRRRSTRSESPPLHPSYRHQRRNAIIPPLSPEHAHPSSTAISRARATTTTRLPTPATRSSSSPFMDLPGELKNRIYFYGLVKPSNIEITTLNWPTHQPALLKTCKQIRHEALSIFYSENNITANVDDWSPAVKHACHELWARHGLKTALFFSHYFTGGPHWENLLAWLKAFYLGEMKGLSDVVNKNRALKRKTVGVMFAMATAAREHDMLWHVLKELLEAQRGLLVKGDGRWAN